MSTRIGTDTARSMKRRDAAAYLAVSLDTLDSLTKSGAVPAVYLTGSKRSKRYLRDELDAYLDQCAREATA